MEKLRADPTLTDSDRQAFDLLAAADDLLVRAAAKWEHRDAEGARRDALMGQIKLKTAVAILQADRARARIAELDADLEVARDEDARLDDQLATVKEEVVLLQRLSSMKTSSATERKAFAEQFETAKKQAVTERQRMAEQLAAERHRAEALDGIRRAELAIRTAETMDAARYAKAKYLAATNMLQEAHKEFDAGRWDEALTRTTLALTEAEGGIKLARPLYEAAAATVNERARDRALEADATAVSGVKTRLEREGDLQRLVLLLSELFSDKQSVLLPEGAKVLDAVKDLLAKYPTYPIQVTGFAEGQGTPADLAALSLARANAVYWALVTRGIDPKRMHVDGQPTNSQRIELSVLYHIGQ